MEGVEFLESLRELSGERDRERERALRLLEDFGVEDGLDFAAGVLIPLVELGVEVVLWEVLVFFFLGFGVAAGDAEGEAAGESGSLEVEAIGVEVGEEKEADRFRFAFRFGVETGDEGDARVEFVEEAESIVTWQERVEALVRDKFCLQ